MKCAECNCVNGDEDCTWIKTGPNKNTTFEMTNPITAQEVFDKSYNHVVSQGEPSIDKNGNCLYRGPEGKMCAVGPFISDDLACKGEIDDVFDLSKLNEFPEELIPHVKLLDCMQGAHDNAAFVNKEEFLTEFKKLAASVAQKFNLEVPQ